MEPSQVEAAAQQLQKLLQDEDVFNLSFDSLGASADSSLDDVFTEDEAEVRARASPRDPSHRAVYVTEKAHQPATVQLPRAIISSNEDAPKADSYSSTEDLGNWALMKAASRGEDDRVEELLKVSDLWLIFFFFLLLLTIGSPQRQM